jgi:hypothetical protein
VKPGRYAIYQTTNLPRKKPLTEVSGFSVDGGAGGKRTFITSPNEINDLPAAINNIGTPKWHTGRI